MSLEFFLRIAGMFVFGIIGARFGGSVGSALAIPIDSSVLLFSLVGALFGLIVTPWFTTRPARAARRLLLATSTETVVMAFAGLVLGLIPAVLLAYPLSLLPSPFGSLVPTLLAALAGYLGMSLFAARADDLFDLLDDLRRGGRLLGEGGGAASSILLDTSVIIDGRIQDIAETGFLNWTLVVPRFVLEELQHIADSSDILRRNRGKRGLEVLRNLKRMDNVMVDIVDDDVPDVEEVDHKLLMLARQMNVPIMTNDFNLNQIAKLQGVRVLNLNMLANAVRAEFIPGEVISLKIIQEGKEPDQGVGYLQDGTMVVVEEGRQYLDRTIQVEITRLISREAGKMYFGRPVQS
ncbi:MAG: PIN/TRAM domain-containing protein [Anaerolineae bacterium]